MEQNVVTLKQCRWFYRRERNVLKCWISSPVAKVDWHWCTLCLLMWWWLERVPLMYEVPAFSYTSNILPCSSLNFFLRKPLSQSHCDPLNFTRNRSSLQHQAFGSCPAKRLERFQTTYIKLLMSRHSFPTTLPNASMYTGEMSDRKKTTLLACSTIPILLPPIYGNPSSTLEL